MVDFILSILWDDAEDGNVAHLAEHDVTPAEAEHVIRTLFDTRTRSASNEAYWVVKGYSPARRLLLVVFEYIAEAYLVIPVTAYEPEPELKDAER